jgi:hypothetical protein
MLFTGIAEFPHYPFLMPEEDGGGERAHGMNERQPRRREHERIYDGKRAV